MCDVAKEDFPREIVDSKVSFASLFFCLSAIAPHAHAVVLKRIYDVLEPGGMLFFSEFVVTECRLSR